MSMTVTKTVSMAQSAISDKHKSSLGRGESIGRYVVLALVGRGAMGEVYAAYDPELDRKVAVKLLRAQDSGDLSASEAKTRLLREAQAIAKLSHPNVIVVHDVGSFGDRVFIAMEYVEGNTVGYWLLSGKRTWKEVLRVFLDAGRGLAAAHASHLVHRDFKVENVMVGRDGQVRVMDFGLARQVAGAPEYPEPVPLFSSTPSLDGVPGTVFVDDDAMTATRILTPSDGQHPGPTPIVDVRITAQRPGPGTTGLSGPLSAHSGAVRTNFLAELTETGAIIGTPAYMAPEQFDRNPADERSDQFSFCVALYEGLYGDRPFAGSTLAELTENVRRGRVLPPPDSTSVPNWLRRVVLRGLRVRPSERWPSMEALLGALQKDPGVAWRRWALVGCAALGIAGIGVVARRQGARESRPTCQVAADRFAHVWESAKVAGGRRALIASAFHSKGIPYAADAFTGTARLLDGYVASWSAMYTDSCEATNLRGEQSAEVLDLRTSCLRDRWNELRALSDVLADPDGQVVANAVKAAAALTPLDRCADVRTLRSAIPPANDPAVRRRVEELRTRLATAKALEDAGRFGKALVAAAQLVADARSIGHPPLLAEALARLGGIQDHMGKASEAEATLDEAVWTAEATRYDEIVAASSVEQIYVVGAMQLDMPRARRWLRQAEAFLTRLEGHDLLWAWMLNNFGTALESHGDLDEALSRYREALKIKERILGSLDPDVGSSMSNVASVLMSLGRAEEALGYSDRGVAIASQALGSEHPDTAFQLAVRANILNRVGRYLDAQRDAKKALTIWERELGPQHVDLPFFLGPLGEAELGLEQPVAAAAHLDRALGIRSDRLSPSELRKLRFALARALWEGGDDRRRALQVGALAAAPPTLITVGDKVGGASEQARDREVQDAAAAWLVSRQRGKSPGTAVVSRLNGGRQPQ